MDTVDKPKCSSNGESDKSSGSSDGGRKSEKRRRSRSPYRRRKDRSRSSDRSASRRRRKERRSSSSSRSRSRSRDRSSKYSSRRRRSSRNSSDDNSDQRSYKTQYDSYKYQEPNSTIMVRCLAPHLTENDIRQDLLCCGFMVKDIRLIKNRETGQSRGFAFIEFNSVMEAVRWMDIKKGVLLLHEQFQASLLYSVPKVTGSDGTRKMVGSASDWVCERCHGQNFKRREFCYKCSAPRPEEEVSAEISSHPTQRIILSNLDMLTTEEGVLQVFQSRPSLAALPIKSVRIAREPGSSISKGICYVEAHNVTEASKLFAILNSMEMEIDGRTVSAAYGKTASPETLLKNINAAATAVAAAQWTNSSTPGASSAVMSSGPPCTEVKNEADVEKMAKYCAFLYAKNHKEYSSYLDYYRQYYKAELAKVSSVQLQQSSPETTGVAASGNASYGWSDVKEAGVEQSAPDASRYQYDEASGYYYDPVSGLYYDATTQYFYDSVKQQFLQWSPEEQKYVAVQSSPSGDGGRPDTVGEEKQKEKRGDQKVKVAKSVAKEMQKWVKTLNQKKDSLRAVPAEIDKSVSVPSASSTASKKFSLSSFDQEYVYTAQETLTAYQPAVMVESIPRPESDSDSGSDEGQAFNASKETSIVDEIKLACLLCKRRFPSKEVLEKHLKISDLHKKNLEGLEPNSSSISYRDRAKERRDMFGIHVDVDVRKNELRDLYLQAKEDLSTSYVEEPTANGINDDNIGSKMLQKMGWQKGQGLGRDNQGRVDIIMTERRAEKIGLGIKGAEVDDEKLDPQAKIRKRTLARYQELG